MEIRTFLLFVACIGCGDKSSAGAESADLQVAFGGATPISVSETLTKSSVTNRLLVRVDDADVSTLLSLALPIESRTYDLSSSMDAVVWAKRNGDQPLVATEGTLHCLLEDGKWWLKFERVLKEADQLGESVLITGSLYVAAAP